MPSQRYYRDKEGAFYAADGMQSRQDVWRNDQRHQPNIGYGYFAVKPEYVGRFSGGVRRFSDQPYPQRAYNLPPQPLQRSLPYYHQNGYVPYPYPVLIGGNDHRRAVVRKKHHASKTAQKRQRSSAQFYPGISYPNSGHQRYTHYAAAFPSSPSSPLQNNDATSPNYLTYQQSLSVDDTAQHHDVPNYFHNTGKNQTPVWYKNETELPNTFASRFTRDNRPYYISEEKTRGGEILKYDEFGRKYFANSVDEVEEEIERNVQDISSDLENYKNEIILRPPGSRAGLAISRPISRIENVAARTTSRNEVEKQGSKYNNVVQTASQHLTTPSWTSQLASILRSKQDSGSNKSKPYHIRPRSKPPAQHTQVIHKFLPDATFGIHQHIMETDDHAFYDFECNCNGCSSGNNAGPLPEDNKNNLGHSYYNLLDDEGNNNKGHFEHHDANNNDIDFGANLRISDKTSSLNASIPCHFDAKNVPKLR